MKNKRIFICSAILGCIATLSSAQINVTSAGQVSVGTTVAPASSAIGLWTYGDAIFTTSTTNTSTSSAPFINAANGYSSATAPDYTWWYDSQTGIFHPAGDKIGLTAGGTDILDVVSPSVTSQLISTTLSTSNSSTVWDIYCTATGYNKWTFYVYGSGDLYGKSGTWWSDRRLKENIITIPNALDKVLKLRGVNFTYIADAKAGQGNPQMQMGLIAQEVEKVVPEVVRTGSDGMLGIQYQNLVGLLIEAMKEQNKRIDSLQTVLNSCCNANSFNQNATGTGSLTNPAPNGAALYQNVPNPFTQNTTITCIIPEQSNSASLMVFDMNGGLKKTIPVNGKNKQSIVVNGGQLAASMYYYTLIVDGKEIDTKKMILTQ